MDYSLKTILGNDLQNRTAGQGHLRHSGGEVEDLARFRGRDSTQHQAILQIGNAAVGFDQLLAGIIIAGVQFLGIRNTNLVYFIA